MGRAERAFPWERGLPSPPANGRAHAPRHALRARGGLKVRAPEQCPAAAQGATGIPARDFPPVGRDRRARRDFNPKSAIENGVEPPRHQGTKGWVVSAGSFSSPLGLRVLSEAGVTPTRDVVGGAGVGRNGWACGWKERSRCGEMRVSRQDPKTQRGGCAAKCKMKCGLARRRGGAEGRLRRLMLNDEC